MLDNENTLIDFAGPVNDTSKNIIKVIGVGGGGCNAVSNMYKEGMQNVTFAACNTDSKSLSQNEVPVKVMLGTLGLGAGADPEVGRQEAEKSIDEIRHLFDDSTRMAFIVAAMGGGTGTGAAPVVAKVAKEKGMLTIGIVTLPFYFEKKPKILKALNGLEEVRKNVDAMLIINNEKITKIFSDSHISVNDALARADKVMADAVRSISELITLNGKIQTDFRDVETTMRNGGGAIMAIGRASGENRLQSAVINALSSPLLYGNDISKASRILLNIYTNSQYELYVDELEQIDAFMESLDPNIEFIWGLATDETLDADVRVTILATGIDNSIPTSVSSHDLERNKDEIIAQLYGRKKRQKSFPLIPALGQEEPADATDDPTTSADNPTVGVEQTIGDEPTADDAPAVDDEDNAEQADPASTFLNKVLDKIKEKLLSTIQVEE